MSTFYPLHKPHEYQLDDQAFHLTFPKLAAFVERTWQNNDQENRTRYARAVAADHNLGREFNNFSEDRILPCDDNTQAINFFYSMTQLRLYPDFTVRILEKPRLFCNEPATLFTVEIIEFDAKRYKGFHATREELEELTERYPLRAGTLKERDCYINQEVNSMSLYDLHEAYLGYCERQVRRIDPERIQYADLGKEKVSNAVNQGMHHDYVLQRMGACLPRLLSAICNSEMRFVRMWAQEINKRFEPVSSNDECRQKRNLSEIINAKSALALCMSTLQLIESLIGDKELQQKAPYVHSLLSVDPGLAAADIGGTTVKRLWTR